MNDGAKVTVTEQVVNTGMEDKEQTPIEEQSNGGLSEAQKTTEQDVRADERKDVRSEELERELSAKDTKIKEFEAKLAAMQEEHKRELRRLELRSKVSNEVLKQSPQDVDLVLGLIDFDKLGEDMSGLTAQLEELRKSKEFLFKKDWNPRSDKPAENIITQSKENTFGKWLLNK